MKSVLIITSKIDSTVDYIMEMYHNVAIFYRLNIDEFFKYRINIGGTCQWSISCKEWTIEKSELYSIYYRKPILPDLREYDEGYRVMIAKDIIATINGIADDFEGKVLTKPYILRKTENKVFQLLFAMKAGLNIPKSYIGNDKDEALKNMGLKKSVIKPLTMGKIRNGEATEIFQTNFIYDIQEDIEYTPIYIQNYEEKQYEIRLTFINGQFFAIRIDSEDKLDWRRNYAGLKYSEVECPPHIINSCLAMMEEFDLKFGAFDFIVNKNDEWIYLEVNPNGQWLWLEKSINIPISSHIVKYLIE